jgi:predicted HicB family RNase H-like nuclease
MIKKQKGRGRPPLPDERRKGKRIEIRADPGERDAYEAAADAAGIDLSEWIRTRLNRAAKHETRADKP